jgi:glycine/D-amino acid oxidase-like deaminating enzyme
MGQIVIIGGGFFGMYIAEYFARKGKKVLVCEKEADFMQRASYANQARVHNGYHYPRSILTALRSRVSFPRFCNEFTDCIDSSFQKYYMVGKILGKVTARQFEKFCHRIGAPCQPAPQSIVRLTNPNLIEAVFSTTEYAFDAIKLKKIMKERIDRYGVEYRHNTMVDSIQPSKEGLNVVVYSTNRPNTKESIKATQVFNCTYSLINSIHKASGFEIIPLKHEVTEMCLVELPDELKNTGITIMCGPFFSIMPFPPRGLHTFSHVRYTPHYEWYDDHQNNFIDGHAHLTQITKKSFWPFMQIDGQRYIPLLSKCKYHDSIWEVKTVLPRSESDDSRPILFRAHHGLKGFHSVMGGKIDNVYDVIGIIEKMGLS